MEIPPIDSARLAAMPILDEAAIGMLRDPELGGEPEFLVEVVEAFLLDTPPRLGTIRATLAAGDSEALARAAHAVKGSSGHFGARRVQALCAELERLGRAGDPGVLAPLVEQLDAEYGRVEARLRELVAEVRLATVE